METNLQIRRFKFSDKNKIIALNKMALKQVGIYIRREWNDDLNHIEDVYLKEGEFLVGEYNGKIIAMGSLKKETDELAEIKRMRVHPKYQGKGFGQIMLTALEDKARELGYKKLILATSIKQVAAQHLYLKNNYKEVRRGEIGILNIENIYSKIENIHYEKKL